MSIKSLAFASAIAVAALGLSGCVSEDGPYGAYDDGYYESGAVFLGGGYYDGGSSRYRHHSQYRNANRGDYVSRRDHRYAGRQGFHYRERY